VPLAFVYQGIALGIYVLVALIWLVPDTRFERVLTETAPHHPADS
jgi:hypothetical protein